MSRQSFIPVHTDTGSQITVQGVLRQIGNVGPENCVLVVVDREKSSYASIYSVLEAKGCQILSLPSENQGQKIQRTDAASKEAVAAMNAAVSEGKHVLVFVRSKSAGQLYGHFTTDLPLDDSCNLDFGIAITTHQAHIVDHYVKQIKAGRRDIESNAREVSQAGSDAVAIGIAEAAASPVSTWGSVNNASEELEFVPLYPDDDPEAQSLSLIHI